MRSFTKILLSYVTVLFTTTTFAQDIIVLKDKTANEIKVKITEISKKDVKYKKWSYQEGPTFSIPIDDILIIKYQNGEEQVFSKVRKPIFMIKDSNSKKDKKAKRDIQESTSFLNDITIENNITPIAKEENFETKQSYTNNTKDASKQKSNKYDPMDFSAYGVSYFAGFKGAGYGHYMLGGSFFSSKGWGGDLHIGANYGLVDSDYASVSFLIGPSYGYAINNLLISASLNFCGTYANTGETEMTGVNGNGKEYNYLGIDSKFGWGIALMPKVALKLGKVQPWLGVNAAWAKGSKDLAIGFQVGIGFEL